MTRFLCGLCGDADMAGVEAALAPSFARKEREGRLVEEEKGLFGPVVRRVGCGVSRADRPRLPFRLMASLYLKHRYDPSDEAVVERWSENVVLRYFGGGADYGPKPLCAAIQLGRFRKAIGEAGVEERLKARIDTAVSTRAVMPEAFERIIVDTTVQEKAIAHPVDSRPLEIARSNWTLGTPGRP